MVKRTNWQKLGFSIMGFLLLAILFPKEGWTFSGACSFLKIGIGARAGGMGDVGSTVIDSTAVHWNPACLSYIQQMEVSYMHNVWFAGLNHGFLGYAHPFKGFGFGLGVNYLCAGEIEETTKEKPRGTGRRLRAEDDLALILSLGKKIGRSLSFGLSIKHIQQRVAWVEGKGVGVDLGTLLRLPRTNFGFVVQNLGGKIRLGSEEFPLPLNFRGGISYHGIENITLAFDMSFPKEGKVGFHLGGEWWPASSIALRVGYNSRIQEAKLGVGISGGFGVRFGGVRFDVAYLPYGELGDTYRVSVHMNFGAQKADERREKVEEKRIKPKVMKREEPINVIAGGLEMEITLTPHPHYTRFYIKIKNLADFPFLVSPYNFLLLTKDGKWHSVSTKDLPEEDLLSEKGLQPGKILKGYIFFKTHQPPKELIYKDYLGNSMRILF